MVSRNTRVCDHLSTILRATCTEIQKPDRFVNLWLGSKQTGQWDGGNYRPLVFHPLFFRLPIALSLLISRNGDGWWWAQKHLSFEATGKKCAQYLLSETEKEDWRQSARGSEREIDWATKIHSPFSFFYNVSGPCGRRSLKMDWKSRIQLRGSDGHLSIWWGKPEIKKSTIGIERSKR